MTDVAVVGVGGWGRNLARIYYQMPESVLRYICDTDQAKLDQLAAQYVGTRVTTRYETLLEDRDLDAVLIATPATTHYELARRALDAGKDVYVEKPFVLSISHAQELIERAETLGRILMVGHLLEYHPVMRRLKAMIENDELGDIYYIYNQRVNLGTVRNDENALWNFAPHDVSMILHLLNAEPTDVSARGQSYLQNGIEDVVFLCLNFNGTSMAHVHVSWLDPHKVRKMTVVGSKKMAVFDDLEAQEKLRIYDKGATCAPDYNNFAEYIGLRFGDISVPYIKASEPLRLESEHFLECVRERRIPLSDGRDGLRVTKVLEAAERSLKKNGAPVSIAASP